jgi:3-deoxy-D-manno-octulosonic-acid transferase
MIAPAIGALAPHARVFLPEPERQLWHERMGEAPAVERCDAWVHAASMGEATAASPLARVLRERAPAAQLLLTATSATGRARLAATAPAALAPIDSPQAVARFLAGARPARLFVIETEIWPHWLLGARRAGLPVSFVSARLSQRSVARYQSLGPGLRRLIGGLALVLCQSEADAGRWRAIGAPAERTRVTGNLKFDALAAPEPDRAAARRALGLDPERPVLTLGSLRPGEAGLIAAAWMALTPSLRERWQVVAVPRHSPAAAGLMDEARRAGVAVGDPLSPGAGAWRWDERAGVLGAYYGVCDVAFVGASLVPLGGHNPLEPAARGAAVLMGPFGSHQQPAVDRLLASRGLAVSEPAGLPGALSRLLSDESARAALAAGGLDAVATLRGATARTVDALEAAGLWPVR